MSSKVYFTREITPEKVVALYRALGVELPGKVAVKVHSGEKGNQNFLHPDFWELMIRTVNGTVVECNTAYSDKFGGVRGHTESHLKLLAEHGWTPRFTFDIMDSEGPDLIWPIPHGKVLKENHVGRHISTYDSMLVLAHFKGHPMGGYGGALKQLAIGCASRGGKALIHSGGKSDDRFGAWEVHASREAFPEAMADAAWSIVDHFKNHIAFINVMKNLSVDCDCCVVAEDPCMKDIGMLASLDPVAINQAAIDLVMQSDDPGNLLKFSRSRNRRRTSRRRMSRSQSFQSWNRTTKRSTSVFGGLRTKCSRLKTLQLFAQASGPFEIEVARGLHHVGFNGLETFGEKLLVGERPLVLVRK